MELAASARFSFAMGILFESILRLNDPQNGFYTAKTLSGHGGAWSSRRPARLQSDAVRRHAM
jgi:hypothetical protein